MGDNELAGLAPKAARSDPDKKPELVAPGERIPMLNAQIGDTNSLHAWGSGTSGATVWVTGAQLHMLEHRPIWYTMDHLEAKDRPSKMSSNGFEKVSYLKTDKVDTMITMDMVDCKLMP